jgi:hypothetical protein
LKTNVRGSPNRTNAPPFGSLSSIEPAVLPKIVIGLDRVTLGILLYPFGRRVASTAAIAASVESDGRLARTASTRAIVASVAGEGMWAGAATAVSNRLQALIISSTDEAAARTSGDQVRVASSASAADAAATKIALASLRSSRALFAIGADPRSK